MRSFFCIHCAFLMIVGLSACRGDSSGGDGDGDADAEPDSDFDAARCLEDFPLGGNCEPFAQGCCEQGERCTLVSDFDGGVTEGCIPTQGSGLQWANCASGGDNACAPGYYCLEHAMVSFCTRFCENSGDCENNGNCAPLPDIDPGYYGCNTVFADCHPVERTGCGEGFVCVLEIFPNLLFQTCLPEGVHGVGEDCSDGAGCQDGSGCYSDGTNSNCYEYCVLGENCKTGACFDINPSPMTPVLYGICPLEKE